MVTCWNLGNSDSFAFIQSNIRTNFYERNPPLMRTKDPILAKPSLSPLASLHGIH